MKRSKEVKRQMEEMKRKREGVKRSKEEIFMLVMFALASLVGGLAFFGVFG